MSSVLPETKDFTPKETKEKKKKKPFSTKIFSENFKTKK